MDQQQQQGGMGRGRGLHIAHRRSPSELTPLMMEQLALQQQIELLQAQQAQIANAQQYLASGGFPQQGMPQGMNPMFAQQMHPHNLSPQGGQTNFQFPQQQIPQGAPTQPSAHRRQQSAFQGTGLGGAPAAPSSGTAGMDFGNGGMQHPGQGGSTQRENAAPQRNRASGPPAGGGHQRRHSLALPEAKRAAEIAKAKQSGTTPASASGTGFQFPIPSASGSSTSPTNSGATPTSAQEEPSSATSTTSSGGVSLGASQHAPGGMRGRGGHGRSQSLAVGMNGRSPVATRQPMGTFQFPPPAADNSNNSNTSPQIGGQSGDGVQRNRSGGQYGHSRTGSRNFDGNWRQSNQSMDMGGPGPAQFQQGFTPGHRPRASMGGSVSSIGFQFPGQPQFVPQQAVLQQMQPNIQMGMGMGVPLAQLQALQLGQNIQQLVTQQGFNQQQAMGQNQQQQRKTLFTPYLPQASLPALLGNGQLVSGILRVNKKNRSDAYVSTQDGILDADIFICGSKDRNRALEGDMVAVELLDVDEVWGQKREKEEKKKRKDISDTRSSDSRSNNQSNSQQNDATSGDGPQEGGLRRRGSLRQRPTQKKNDDVEVEGQGLLLVEEEEVSDEQKPLFAGHIVAVIERVAGQMFSGTLGLLRPSSQATKEKQEAERQAREGQNSRPHQERQQDKPKIVWFKPTDKRVPLIAIPTEQAPRDFVENHAAYANRIFVACIKRWPITSLHPFGTLVEQLGEMGDIRIETDALLRDNNFGPDEFSDAVLKSVGLDDWSVESEGEAAKARKDFTSERVYTFDPNGAQELDSAIHVKKIDDKYVEIGVHIADVAHFVKPNSLVDREAKKRGTGVYLINRTVPMLPPKISADLCTLKPGVERYAVSVVFKVESETGSVVTEDTWVGKSIVKSISTLSFKEVDGVILDHEESSLDKDLVGGIKLLKTIAEKFRQNRYNSQGPTPPLRLIYQLDDENVPVEHNIYNSTPAHDLIEEIMIKTNAFIAEKIVTAMPDRALLRRHAPPIQRRLDTFGDRMGRLDTGIEISSSETLHKSLFNLRDDVVRKGMETLLIKAMHRAKYFVAGKFPQAGWGHYSANVPLYTHFTSPVRRYADIIVHRQLESILVEGAEFTEDAETLMKTAEQCNIKKDSSKNAQEQSIHLELCRVVDKKRQEVGGELICDAIVICVYESAFDVLIPEYGFEKRVHCDQLPLKKAEFDKKNRVLELYWEKGVQSSAYIPEDERPKGGAALRASQAAAAASAQAAADKAAREQEEKQRKAVETNTFSADDVDALFDDDDEDDDGTDEGAELDHDDDTGATLNAPTNNQRPTQSMPPSPTKGSPSGQTPHRTRSDPKMAHTAAENAQKAKATSKKEQYLAMFDLREESGDYIQEIRELKRVPVILRAELSKSPPCLTIRTLNPYAL